MGNPRSRWSLRFWPGLAISALILVGLGLRFYHLGARGLWLDEIIQSDVTRLHHRDLLAFAQHDDQMPFFSIVTWTISRVAQENEFMLRLPSALAGSVGVYVMYRLGRVLGGFRLGFLCGLLFALMAFGVWYAQDARPYALFITASAAQLLFAWQVVKKGSPFDWAGLVFVTVISLYTHYLALLATAAVALFLAVAAARQRRTLILALVSGIVVVLAYLPWLPTLIGYLQGKSQADVAKIGGGPWLPAALTIPEAFGLTGVVLIVFAVGVARAGISWRDRRGWLLVSWVGLPLLVLAVRLHAAALTLWPRYLSFLFPVAVLLVALGADTVAEAAALLISRYSRTASGHRTGAQAVGTSLAVTLLLAQLIPALTSSYHAVKDQYREAVNQVLDSSSPDSVIIAGTPYRYWILEAFPYYLSARHSLIPVALSNDLGATVLTRLHSGGGIVWLAFPNPLDPDGMRRLKFIAVGPDLPDVSRLDHPGLRVTSLVGVTLVREVAPQGTTEQQALTLLRWLSHIDRDVGSQINLLQRDGTA
jgi:mannosyltransferase